MAINKRAAPATDAGEKFIAKAVGGEHAVRWVRGNRTQITLSIAPELLRQVDAIAHRRHLSRAALLTVWLGEKVEQEAVAREAA
jgi:hypothetical protein